jgi:hypothetical protein
MPFGQGRFRDQWAKPWQNHRLLENHSRIRVGGLLGHSEVTIVYGGKTQTVEIEEERWEGKYAKLRPWFRCPSCNQRCRLLHEKDGAFMCRLCTGYDYTCRHRNRSTPTLNRIRSVAGLPHRALAREALIAQVEIARLLHATVSDLERRAKRGKR